jgi:hypothetical protein
VLGICFGGTLVFGWRGGDGYDGGETLHNWGLICGFPYFLSFMVLADF